MQSCQMTKTTTTTALIQTLTDPKKILESEGVDRTRNETEEREVEGVDSETEVMDSDNEGVDKEVLHPEKKGYRLIKTPNVKYSDKIST